MQDEYLSELVLRKLSPARGARLPKVVTMEWGLVLPEEPPRLALFGLRAEGVTRWSFEGEWKKDGALEVRSVTDAGGIALELGAPSTISLTCRRLTIERGPTVRYRPPPRPDPARFLVHGPRETCWAEVLGWLAPLGDLELHRQVAGAAGPLVGDRDRPIVAPLFETFRLMAPGAAEPALFLSWSLAVTMRGHHIAVARGAADDALWSRALRLPEHLGEGEVISGTLRVPSGVWARDWAPHLG